MQASLAFIYCVNVKRKFTYAVAELQHMDEGKQVEVCVSARFTLRICCPRPLCFSISNRSCMTGLPDSENPGEA